MPLEVQVGARRWAASSKNPATCAVCCYEVGDCQIIVMLSCAGGGRQVFVTRSIFELLDERERSRTGSRPLMICRIISDQDEGPASPRGAMRGPYEGRCLLRLN